MLQTRRNAGMKFYNYMQTISGSPALRELSETYGLYII